MSAAQSVIETYKAMHPRSSALYERARAIIPGGVTHDGRPFAEYPLVTLEPVAMAGFPRRTWDTLRLWLK